MKSIIIVCLIVGAFAQERLERAREEEAKKMIPIVRYLGSLQGDEYNFDTEGGDGTKFQESGSTKMVNNAPVSVKTGSVSWTSPEGIPFEFSYTSDENGFHPVASHLPQAPPTPTEILKVLPLLPKIDELQAQEQERQRIEEESLPVQVQEAVVPVQRTVVQPSAFVMPMQQSQSHVAQDSLVDTPEFTIDQKQGKTSVRIGQQ